MPEILAPYTESIHKLIQGIFDEKVLEDMIEKNKWVLMIGNFLLHQWLNKFLSTSDFQAGK